MLEIVDKITIKCNPSAVYNTLLFFFQSSEHYKIWHKDHISCYWKKGKDFHPHSVLIAEEYLHGSPHKLGFKIIKNQPDQFLQYKMLFPFSLLCYGGFFKMVPKDSETEFTAQLGFRYGSLLKILFKKEIESVKNHMKEEGVNMKEIIEKSG